MRKSVIMLLMVALASPALAQLLPQAGQTVGNVTGALEEYGQRRD